MDNKKLIYHLKPLVSEKRFNTFLKIINQRTNYITVVLEDIFQPHNASAVLRSCDCFGIQNIHIIENKNTYTINPDVALGSFKWLSLTKHNEKEHNSIDTINYLKAKGYRIVATSPHTNDLNLNEFDLSKGKAAIFFGTELNGLSEEVLKNADEFIKIPMYGFTESFNISVSAAIILYELTNKLRNSSIDWQLSNTEKDIILIEWLKASIKKSDQIIELFKKHN